MPFERLLGGWPQLFLRILHDYSQRALHTVMGSPVHRLITQSLTAPSRPFDKDKLSLFSVVKNEMFLLPAFLDHHRSIGIQQFLILVDHSDDGTLEYLLEQPDVVVVECSVKFGDNINVSPFSRLGLKKMDRAAAWLKEVITQEFFANSYALYLDADEFLFLPPGHTSVDNIIASIRRRRVRAVSASVVEFFPEKVAELFVPGTPTSLPELINRYPYFEPTPLLRLRRFRFPERIGWAKSGELFLSFLNSHDEGMTTLKTPIVRHSALCFRRGSHRASLPPTSRWMLTVGHFKFTSVSEEKFREATESKLSYFREMYGLLENLLTKMHESSASFLSPHSQRFSSSQQFVDAGLMRLNDGDETGRWPERRPPE